MTSQIILFHRGLLQYNDNNGGNSDGNGNKLIFEDVCPSHNMTAPSLISLISLPFHRKVIRDTTMLSLWV